MSEMADKEEGRAGRLYDDIIKELEGEKEAAPAAPVLPRLRLTTPSSKAPLTIKKKFSGAQAPLVAAAQLLPEIMRQVDEARKAQAEARSRKQSPAARAAVDAAPLVVPVGEPAPPKINNSRVAWRYALVFGKRIDRVWKGRARQLAEDHLEDKAIYTVRG